jgi:hypothetical protein
VDMFQLGFGDLFQIVDLFQGSIHDILLRSASDKFLAGVRSRGQAAGCDTSAYHTVLSIELGQEAGLYSGPQGRYRPR